MVLVGISPGPLDCSGAGSLVSGGCGACTGGDVAAIGVGGSCLTFSGEDFTGSATRSEGLIGLGGSECTAGWSTTFSSFIGLSDSTGVDTATGSFDSITGGTGAAAAAIGVLGLQSLVEEVW